MKYETVKPDTVLSFEGFSVDTEWRDGSLYSVTIWDKNGDKELKISMSGYMSLQAMVPKPDTVKRWKVRGKVLGLDVEEYYKDEKKASERAYSLQCVPDSDVKAEEVEVENFSVKLEDDRYDGLFDYASS